MVSISSWTQSRKLTSLSVLSQLFHFVASTVRKPSTKLECGALITSIDIDVGSRILGRINKCRKDIKIHRSLSEYRVGKIEEIMTPLIIQFFDRLEIPVTFAIRGQLTQVKSDILELILQSSIEHEIGAHGYYHRPFTRLSTAEAQEELELVSTGLNKFGIKPKSFVFPRNEVFHLSLVERFGYKCYRGKGSLTRDGMYIKKVGRLFDVHPSFHLGFTYHPIFLYQIIDIAANNKLPLHFWFHPRDIFEIERKTPRVISRVLFPLYKYAKKKADKGMLKFETMGSVVDNVQTNSTTE